MKAFASSHVGLVRRTNEDAYYLPKLEERFAVVADGMGGHLAGEVASRMAVDEFVRELREYRFPDEEIMKHAVEAANAAVYRAAQLDISKKGMGTTLTALWMGKDSVCLAHVGDSRAYLLRNGALMQLSRDHSLVGELMEKGELTFEEAMVHPQRNLITRALGTNPKVVPDVMRLDYQKGDVWLLCSDGMSNHVHNHEMAEILRRGEEWQLKADRLVELALDRGGSDNITVVLVVGEEVRK